MMKADSPLHSHQDSESDRSFDEFRDLKDAKDYKGAQGKERRKAAANPAAVADNRG
jgi:hypothetical protein